MADINQHPASLPPAPAVMAILSRYDRAQLHAFLEIAIDLADTLDGDCDLEDASDAEDDFSLSPLAVAFSSGPGCLVSDVDAGAWVEWQAMNGHERKRGQNFTSGHEDAETDDEDCGYDEGEPDMRSYRGEGAGCNISDPDHAIDDLPCDEPHQDLEQEQLPDDVPMLPVLTAEHNIFTDSRVFLGMSNLQSSYRTNGGEVLSADSGEVLTTKGDAYRLKPGGPV